MLPDPLFPRAHTRYPGTWPEFYSWFENEASCSSYLEQLRWKKGFRCPMCGSIKGWRTAKGHWSCGGCARKVSLIAGTIFDGSRIPTRDWLIAAWYMAKQNHGISAFELQRLLGLGSYQSAWTMLHKLRTVMAGSGLDRLRGFVEVGMSYVGNIEHSVCGSETSRQFIVLIAIEVLSSRLGRVRLRRIRDVSSDNLVRFICDVVERGAKVHTGGAIGYKDLPERGYRHIHTRPPKGDPARVSMPGVCAVASLLKRWLLDIYKGAVTAAHVDAYLDEFTFNFNCRHSRCPGLLFYRLLKQAVATPPSRYRPQRGQYA